MSTVRVMTEADVAAVSEIRVTGWKAAYAGIVPQSYLDRMTVEADAHQRRRYVMKPDKATIDLVAVDAQGAVVGWACFGPSRTAAGELYALYVRPSLIGTGIGRTLLRAVHANAAAHGFGSVLLWVLTDNTPARRFYERAGYVADGAVQADDYDGVSLSEVRYRVTL
ncbi:GNAT family N-acetyltransferase [Streptomyces sp. NPDC085540]|uniref:GNAT family N-acetyltransferase n=1 Tax=Streptomyces sp. NPDC085540 TaxID=3365730 RepID=UPI0037D71D88